MEVINDEPDEAALINDGINDEAAADVVVVVNIAVVVIIVEVAVETVVDAGVDIIIVAPLGLEFVFFFGFLVYSSVCSKSCFCNSLFWSLSLRSRSSITNRSHEAFQP